MTSVIHRVPVELWQRILYYATICSSLPFTEDGKLSSSLIDNLDLFSTRCAVLRRYRDETQAAVERLRLVCQTWSKLLQPRAYEFVLIDSDDRYFPSKVALDQAKLLGWVLDFSCECRSEDRRTCIYHRIQNQMEEKAKLGTSDGGLPTKLPFNMKILLAHMLRSSSTDIFTAPLVNLAALSFCTLLPGYTSLEHMCSLAPNLTHLQLDVTMSNTAIFTNPVHFSTVRYLFLRILTFPTIEPVYLTRITFPSLRSLRILGWISVTNEGYLFDFISRHGSSIHELDMADFSYVEIELGHFPPQNSVTFWKTCPNISTLGINFYRVAMDDPWYPRNQTPQKITLLLGGRPYLTWEATLLAIAGLNRLRNIWDVEGVIFTRSWGELDLGSPRGPSVVNKPPKWQVEGSLITLEEMGFHIVDRFDVPLSEIIRQIFI